MVDAYKNAGYDFMQLSEHFIGNFDFPIADTRGFRSNSFTTLIGAELHAPETASGRTLAHRGRGPAARLSRRISMAKPANRWPRRAAEAGAFIGIAHPAWSQLTIEDGRAIDCAHAVEIYNHGCAIENDRGDGWYLADQLLTEGHRLTAFATDDAHFKTPDHFGGWVHVKAESLDPDALLTALKAGQYYSSMGPQIHAIEMNGKEISISCSPVDTITVLCGTSRTMVRNGRAITDASFDLAKLEKGWLLKKHEPLVPRRGHRQRRQARLEQSHLVGRAAASRLPLWLVIAGLGLTQIIGWGTTYYALGALSPDIAAATGWSKTLIFGGFSAALLLSGLISRWAGRFIDRQGGRRLMMSGSLPCGTGPRHHRTSAASRHLPGGLVGAGRRHAADDL